MVKAQGLKDTVTEIVAVKILKGKAIMVIPTNTRCLTILHNYNRDDFLFGCPEYVV